MSNHSKKKDPKNQLPEFVQEVVSKLSARKSEIEESHVEDAPSSNEEEEKPDEAKSWGERFGNKSDKQKQEIVECLFANIEEDPMYIRAELAHGMPLGGEPTIEQIDMKYTFPRSYIGAIEKTLSFCSPDTRLIIINQYYHKQKPDWWKDYYCRTTFYTKKKLAITEFLNCLANTLMII